MHAADKIYQDYKAQRITQEQAVSKLLGEIYKSPVYYQIQKLNEDDIGDFVVWIHKYIPSILERYDESKSAFLTYFTTAIRLRSKSWHRLNAKRKILSNTLDVHQYAEVASLAVKDGFELSEPAVEYCGSTELEPALKKPLAPKDAQFILILALKSVNFLSNTMLEKLPYIIGISPEQFETYLKTINESVHTKLKNFIHAETQVNSSYILCQQYLTELTLLDYKQQQFFLVEKQYQSRCKSLARWRQQRQKCLEKLKPSDAAIEELLELPSGTVKRVLNNAELRVAALQELLDPTLCQC